MLAAPAAAQAQPPPKPAVDIAAIPGVVAGGAKWRVFWAGPMIVDGMTCDADGGVLFAQEQSNSIIKVWPNGKWWVQWPYVAGAGSVSIDAQGRTFAADRSCTDPGLVRPLASAPIARSLEDRAADARAQDGRRQVRRRHHARPDQRPCAPTGTAAPISPRRPVPRQGRRHGRHDLAGRRPTPQQGGVFTNGLVLSPDGKTLYVTNRTTILAFDVAADGALSNRRDFATLDRRAARQLRRRRHGGRCRRPALRDRRAGVCRVRQGRQAAGGHPHAAPRDHRDVRRPRPQDALHRHAGRQHADGQNWTTPQGVRNIAGTIYAVDTC